MDISGYKVHSLHSAKLLFSSRTPLLCEDFGFISSRSGNLALLPAEQPQPSPGRFCLCEVRCLPGTWGWGLRAECWELGAGGRERPSLQPCGLPGTWGLRILLPGRWMEDRTSSLCPSRNSFLSPGRVSSLLTKHLEQLDFSCVLSSGGISAKLSGPEFPCLPFPCYTFLRQVASPAGHQKMSERWLGTRPPASEQAAPMLFSLWSSPAN